MCNVGNLIWMVVQPQVNCPPPHTRVTCAVPYTYHLHLNLHKQKPTRTACLFTTRDLCCCSWVLRASGSIIHFHYENRKTFNLRNITRVQERFKNNYSISVQVWFIAIPLTTYSGWRRCILVFPLLLLQKRCNMAYNNGFPHIVHWKAFKM